MTKETDGEDPAGETDLFLLLLVAPLRVPLLFQQLPELLLLAPGSHPLPGQLAPQKGHFHLHLWGECMGWGPEVWVRGRRRLGTWTPGSKCGAWESGVLDSEGGRIGLEA